MIETINTHKTVLNIPSPPFREPPCSVMPSPTLKIDSKPKLDLCSNIFQVQLQNFRILSISPFFLAVCLTRPNTRHLIPFINIFIKWWSSQNIIQLLNDFEVYIEKYFCEICNINRGAAGREVILDIIHLKWSDVIGQIHLSMWQCRFFQLLN